MTFANKSFAGETLSRETFRHPPLSQGILPFWFWNGKLDEHEMEWQLREWKSKGIPGIFIHGRFGLQVPYGSDQWFERVRFAVAKAKEIGIDAWVYDEMNWPSGTAERKVPATYPHLTQRYLELVALQVDGPLFTFLEATDSRYVNTGDSNPIAAFGCTEDEWQHGIRHPIDLTHNLSFNKVLPWEAPPGKWRLLYFLEKEVPYYIDALDPESTRRFIEMTHDRYQKYVGNEFGGTVPGFFTDEPAMHYYQVGVDNYVIPWTKQMFKIFRDRRGYDLRPLLPALYANIGSGTARVRYDFWRTLSEQYDDAYYRQLREWCEAHGVIFTGHLLFEEWTRLHARCEGNIFQHLRQMHMTGVDHLYPKIGTPQEPDQHVALKIASSAAHHDGSTRLICESMGGSYWDCTLERMKWILNWEYVLGVNLFNNHGGHYTIEGERKRDWPPSQFYHHTWWKYYDRFTEFATRCSHLLSGGTHVAKVLVLYPLTSVWANYVPQHRDAVGGLTESDFNYLADALMRLHYDFDYVDEDVLARATIEGRTLRIGDERYEVLILPPVTHVKGATFEAMKKFAKSGGSIIAGALLPVEFMETSHTAAAGPVQGLFGLHPGRLLEKFRNGGNGALRLEHRNGRGNVFVLHGKGLHEAKSPRMLKHALERCITPDVTVSDEEVFYLHRVKNGIDLYFFVNTSQTDRGSVEISFERTAKPELWDPATGAMTPIHVYEVKNGRLFLRLDFPAVATHVVVLDGEIPAAHISRSTLHVESFSGDVITGTAGGGIVPSAEVVLRGRKQRVSARPHARRKPLVLKNNFTFDIEGDNVLALSSWKMTTEADPGDAGRFPLPAFDDSAWLPVVNGAWEVQLPQERYNPTYPVVLWYRTEFTVRDLPAEGTRMLIDGFSGLEYTLYLNGEEVRDKGTRSALDAEIREVSIQRFLKRGKNLVAVRLVVNRRTDGILDLLKIVGRFSLAPAHQGYEIVNTIAQPDFGDWTQQGYPCYSGTGSYSMEFDLPANYLEGELLLEVDCGEDVLEASVNGSPGIVRPWHPYVIDISPLVKEGTNTLTLKVTNTLINILEAVEKPSGVMRPPRIVHRHRYQLRLAR